MIWWIYVFLKEKRKRESKTCRERESKDDEEKKEIEGRKGRISES